MTLTISVGSGKGGTGKSMVIANLAVLLARAGHKVCVVDLDLGGADIHVLFGLFDPERTLSDFLSRRVSKISAIIQPLGIPGIELIPGTGDTLQHANMTYQQKQRLFRALATIDTDILLIDVGAGTSYHALDFFMHTDIQLCVTSPEPTAVLDFYNFLQLATIRKALTGFLSTSEVGKTLKETNFETLAQVLDTAQAIKPGARKKIEVALARFNPLLIVNKTGTGNHLNTLKLRKLASRYLGIYLPDLGEIPYDIHIPEALTTYLPVVESAVDSPAAIALQDCSSKLLQVIDLFLKKRSGSHMLAAGGAHVQ